jgi:hypothetical protein
MLHAILLGMFKYMKECFFLQIGKTSLLAQEINALAQKYGELLACQSNCDMPKTKFSKGIHGKGKIMAKEYTGVLLLMATVLHSSRGCKLLCKRKSNFGTNNQLYNWILLVETLLQWEQWLKSDQMEKSQVLAAERKHWYIMYLIKKVGKWSKGMGLKLMKFHGIMHMYMDILHFGVPKEVDTETNESGHKQTKHTQGGETFRAHTWFQGGIWCNWVFIDWGKEHGILPNKIIGFVDLSALPRSCQVSYGGVVRLTPGVYAIVEDVKYLKLKHLMEMSDLFVPIRKDCGKLVDGQVVDAKYYLADVEAFHSTAVVIPDIRG